MFGQTASLSTTLGDGGSAVANIMPCWKACNYCSVLDAIIARETLSPEFVTRLVDLRG